MSFVTLSCVYFLGHTAGLHGFVHVGGAEGHTVHGAGFGGKEHTVQGIGALDGAADGAIDGVIDGFCVGATVGLCVGATVGLCVGATVGLCVGVIVGLEVGIWVGALLGGTEGEPVRMLGA